jgi:hypothetical protein
VLQCISYSTAERVQYTMSRVAQPVFLEKPRKQYLDMEEAVRYLHDLGLATVTPDTIRTHAYRTGKLPRPIVVGKPRRSYWKLADLDKLVESL